MIFPINFDINLYKNNNKDLQNMNDNDIIEHYRKYGKNEGRICCKIFNRDTFRQCIPTNYKCLEIGPFDCPVLMGKNVKYFDILNQEELQKRSLEHKRSILIKNIPIIDYVDKEGNL